MDKIFVKTGFAMIMGLHVLYLTNIFVPDLKEKITIEKVLNNLGEFKL